MDDKWLGHVISFGRFQETNQSLGGRVLVMMAAVTSIRLFVEAAGIQSELGEHESKSVAMGVAGFANARHFRHVAAHTTAKGVNAVHRAVLHRCVAGLAKLVFKQAGFGTDDDQRVGHLSDGLQGAFASVDIMAGDAGHTHFGVLALLPVEILLVAVSGLSARPK
jgi:hypothetical protein